MTGEANEKKKKMAIFFFFSSNLSHWPRVCWIKLMTNVSIVDDLYVIGRKKWPDSTRSINVG